MDEDDDLRAGLSERGLPLYHLGRTLGLVVLDGSDSSRLGEIEALLCREDAAARAKGCDALRRWCGEVPFAALLARPASLHALVAASKAPLAEAASLGQAFGKGDGKLFFQVTATLGWRC